MKEALEGIVETVTYHDAETGFSVLRVETSEAAPPVTVVGRLPAIHAGESIRGEGQWVQNREYGRQFQADSLSVTPPASAHGIRKYLASGLIEGIGPELAGRLVEAFGDGVFEVIEREPKRLLEVSGIGKKRQEVILGAWKEQKALREVLVFLYSHGVSTSQAQQIHRRYGLESAAIVTEDPFRLARDFTGIGFKTADRIAASIGLQADSPRRLRAGLEFALTRFGLDGHCAAPREELLERAAELLGVEAAGLEAELDRQIEDQELVRGVIAERECVYLPPLHFAETRIVDSLALRLARTLDPPREPIPGVIAAVESEVGLELAPGQRRALERALTEPVSIITGGPGVGKTTILRCLLLALKRQNRRVALCAPTGRAARRLGEATGEEASTIHRLLEYNPGTRQFRHDHRQRLECDALILDEASMVDLALFHQLLRALPDGASLTLVGDADQLPSVGPGQVLRDLIESDVVPVEALETIFRQSSKSEIVDNAHRILRGELPEPHLDRERPGEFYFVEAEEPETILEVLEKMLRERIPRRFGLDPLRDVQVLTPMHRSLVGARALNEFLQELLNPPGRAQVERHGRIYRLGDKVMQTENDYDREVFNGDLGFISALDEVSESLLVEMGDRQVRYGFAELDALSPAYACTVHKSQGSEYPAVILPLHTQHYLMLLRKVLYTAVTRARKLVILVGSRRALEIAVGRDDRGQRVSGLGERLVQRVRSGLLPPPPG